MSDLEDPSHSTRDMERMKAIAPHCQGAEAIYTERRLILHVRVQRVEIDPWGVHVTLAPLATPGFPSRSGSATVSAAFGNEFSFSRRRWHVLYVNWTLEFDSESIHAAIQAAQSVGHEHPEWFERVTSALDEEYWKKLRAMHSNVPKT